MHCRALGRTHEDSYQRVPSTNSSHSFMFLTMDKVNLLGHMKPTNPSCLLYFSKSLSKNLENYECNLLINGLRSSVNVYYLTIFLRSYSNVFTIGCGVVPGSSQASLIPKMPSSVRNTSFNEAYLALKSLFTHYSINSVGREGRKQPQF